MDNSLRTSATSSPPTTSSLSTKMGRTKIREISIGVVMKPLITNYHMLESIAESQAHLAPLQVVCVVKSGLYTIYHDARDSFVKLGGDQTYIGVSVDTYNAFNCSSRVEMLWQELSTRLLSSGSQKPCTRIDSRNNASGTTGCTAKRELVRRS